MPAASSLPSRKAAVLPLLLALLVLLTSCKNGATTNVPPAAAPAATASASAGTAASTPSGGCPTANTTAFAKTKFVLHTGLAFGAFHRYLYTPYRDGRFAAGRHGRILAFVKAGAAALFVKREIRLSIEDVKANPTLCTTLAAPLGRLADTVGTAVDRLKSGDASAVQGAASAVTALEGQAKNAGFPITENSTATVG